MKLLKSVCLMCVALISSNTFAFPSNEDGQVQVDYVRNGRRHSLNMDQEGVWYTSIQFPKIGRIQFFADDALLVARHLIGNSVQPTAIGKDFWCGVHFCREFSFKNGDVISVYVSDVDKLLRVFSENHKELEKHTPGQESITLIVTQYPNWHYGHAALRVTGANYDMLYELGRYGRTRGFFREKGDGILRVWENSAKKCIEEQLSHGGSVKLYKLYTTDDQNKRAMKYFEDLMKDASSIESFGDGSLKKYKLKSDYHWGHNNCTTLALEGFEAGTGIHLTSDNIGRGLRWYEKVSISLKGWPNSTFIPQDLSSILDDYQDELEVRTLNN